jgi:GGDEF domain-containing protein
MVGAEGLILAGALVLAAPLERLLAAAPYTLPATLTAGALLAWRFRRSRVLFALILIGLATLALPYLAPAGGAPGAPGAPSGLSPAFLALAFLLPLNLGALTLLGERGVLSRVGRLRLGVILVQALAVAGVAHSEPGAIGELLAFRLLPAGLTSWTAVADTVLLAFGATFVLAAVRLGLRPDPVSRGLLWALPAIFLALDEAARGESPTRALATGALVLVVSVVESSFAMAYRDGLTGLPSRRAFNEELLKLGGRYCIAMVDIDHFKRCNDRHGHDVGDQVLRMVATRLEAVSGGGRAFRYGGEEFAIIFPGASQADCLPHLEDIRKVIKATDFTLRAAGRPRQKPQTQRSGRAPTKKITVSVSIGVAERTPRHETPEAVIKAADKALYRAKKEGRNRVVA